ncbi:MAG: hypothetical protein KA143_07915 [Saprospiraceae bacterium]|nr:hypothetical protein [Saprospiraceae bacterium]
MIRLPIFNYLVLIALLSPFLQCRKDDANVLFKMEYDQLINVPGGLNTVETYSFLLQNLNTNFKTLSTTFNVSPSSLLIIRAGSTQLVDQLNQLDLAKVEKISLLASNLSFSIEKEIAYLEPVPLNSTNSLQLFPSLTDATDIFMGDKFNLRLKIKLRGSISSSTNLRLRLTMNVSNK